MLFTYQVIDQSGKTSSGSIDAINVDVAINSLQRRGLTITSIKPAGETGGILDKEITIFNPISNKDVVILSRQIATLFEAQVSALRVFRLLSAETPNKKLGEKLATVADDLQSGSTISNAFSKHQKIFSPFYVGMVRAGEETGKLDKTFTFLADYLDRSYEVGRKARNALIYPAFVITTFVAVMILMLTLVIPRLTAILLESGQDIPFYTKVVIGMSTFLVDYGAFLIILLLVGAFFVWRFLGTRRGKLSLAELQLSVPYVGDLYRTLFLSRIADNFSTMLTSGIQMVRAVEITASVVNNPLYEDLLSDINEKVKGGVQLSEALQEHEEFPGIFVQMVKVGEETGELGSILETLAKFYRREVDSAVDTLVNLIEPIMIVLLGLGVGFLLASVLIPIYNISAGI
ncbi:MAG: type II secretion system F family protein [Candidatus Pacebacteria bacterium]|nr:type II secretion system F family protein [Candidatus Paceibacterota bacterium]